MGRKGLYQRGFRRAPSRGRAPGDGTSKPEGRPALVPEEVVVDARVDVVAESAAHAAEVEGRLASAIDVLRSHAGQLVAGLAEDPCLDRAESRALDGDADRAAAELRERDGELTRDLRLREGTAGDPERRVGDDVDSDRLARGGGRSEREGAVGLCGGPPGSRAA